MSSAGVSSLVIDLALAAVSPCESGADKKSIIATEGESSPNDGAVAAVPNSSSGTVSGTE